MKTTNAPKHLSAESRRLWKELHEEFSLDPAARDILQVYLESRDRREQARQLLKLDGLIQVDRFGQRKAHPAVAIERDTSATMARTWRLLGFDLAQGPRDE